MQILQLVQLTATYKNFFRKDSFWDIASLIFPAFQTFPLVQIKIFFFFKKFGGFA